MAWIRRKADEHKCELPPLRGRRAGPNDPWPGDLWQCDCSQVWIVREHQIDGMFFEHAPAGNAADRLR